MKKKLLQQLYNCCDQSRLLSAALCALTLVSNTSAQSLSGIKTIPGNYSSIQAAVADLNANGVGGGGVTFNIAAGYTEMITSTIVLSATGTAGNPIVFKKTGTGANPQITAYATGASLPTSTIPDGIWALSGSDYVTIDGIDLFDPPTNNTVATSMEYGYGLFKSSGTNGSQHNTIKNCTITLNTVNNTAWTGSTNIGSNGILVWNGMVDNASTQIVVTNIAGTNSYNSFYSNTISKCNIGISLHGYAPYAPYTLGDTLNDIGGNLPATGNSVLDYGGLTGATAAAYGILVANQWGVNISYNTVNNNTGTNSNHPNVLSGIVLGTAATSTAASATVRYNTVTVKGGGTTHVVSAIQSNAGSSGTNNTIDVSYNTITNCTYTTATTGVFHGILFTSNSVPANTYITHNSILNNSTNSTSASYYSINVNNSGTNSLKIENNTITGFSLLAPTSSSVITGIQLAGGSVTSKSSISNNTIGNFTYAGTASGNTLMIYASASNMGSLSILNNNFTTMNIPTATGSFMYIQAQVAISPNANGVRSICNNKNTGPLTKGSGGTVYAFYHGSTSAGNATVTLYDTANVFSNINLTGTTPFNGWHELDAGLCTRYISGNSITNVVAGTGSMFGIQLGAGTIFCERNTVRNYSNAGNITGIAIATSGIVNGTVANNMIDSLYSSSTSGIVNGINKSTTGATGAKVAIIGNKISRLSNIAATSTANAINGITVSASINDFVINNAITGLYAPLGGNNTSINGINASASSGSIGIINNTIYLDATSTGTNFGTSALSVNNGHNSTVQNNILINKSTANGTGRTVAMARSTSALTNYNTASGNNLFYAGNPATINNNLFYDGTNADNTIAALYTRVGPTRDSLSFTQDIPMISSLAASPFYLQPDTTIVTQIEGGSFFRTDVTTDLNRKVRAGFAGAISTSGAADIGAVEGNYSVSPANQMVVLNNTSVQITGVIPTGKKNAGILRLEVNCTNGANGLSATSFVFNLGGATVATDITNAKLYYTYTDSVFDTTTLVGTTTPSTSFTITGNQRLASAKNYFWLTYDISPSATPANIVDATLNHIIISSVSYFPITGNPSGDRQILSPLSGSYTVGASQQFTTIGEAISRLNDLGMSGPVTLTLASALYNTASGETFPLVFKPFPGLSAVNTLMIVPQTGVTAVISGNSTTSTITFDGVTNMTIDGRQGGTGIFVPGANLSIENKSGGAPAVLMINDASYNQILYTDLASSNVSVANAANAGVINIGTSTGINGNDSNIVRYCDIHDAMGTGAGTPAAGVSSIGSSGVENNYTIIENCNIYNTFHATAVNAAIYVGPNNGNWKINNNHFYQTNTATFTGSATNRSIWVAPTSSPVSENSGFMIQGNFIGGNDSTGTGLYTRGGTTAHVYNAIELNVGVGTPSNVQNNIITNFSSSSGATSIVAFNAININNGNVTITGNIIGSRTVAGAIAHNASATTTGGFTGIRIGNTAGDNTIMVSNNIVSGITVTASSVSGIPEFIGINGFGGQELTITNNMIGDTTMPNSINLISTLSGTSTTAQRVAGIFCNPGVVTNQYIQNNIIANVTTNIAATGTAATRLRGIALEPGSSPNSSMFIVKNNTVRNLSTASQSSGSTTVGSVLGGISMYAVAGAPTSFTISHNRIENLILSGASTTSAIGSFGIYTNLNLPAGDQLINGNMIHSLDIIGTNSFANIVGILTVAGNANITNNMVRLGINAGGASIGVPCSMTGISKTGGNGNVYFNTVYIGGTALTASSAQTFAFNHSGTGATQVLNNIFSNPRLNTSLSAGHFAVQLADAANITMNYNVLNADSIGVFGGIATASLPSWKSTSGVDNNSVTGAPGLINATGDTLTVNLHINPAVATAIEGYGVPVTGLGTDLDFDGQARNALTPIDLGADAGNFIANDIAGPSIVYDALDNTVSTGNRTLVATIKDNSGIFLTGANTPKLYARKNSNTFVMSTGTLVGGTADSSVWSFTISATALSGLAANDSVYYFVTAQDSSANGNVSSYPSGIVATNVNVISVYPNPFSYKITAIINGNFNVGVGAGNAFTTLTGSDGMFSYINSSQVNGNITLTITSDIEEPGTVALNQFIENGGSGFTVKIVPNASTVRTISSSVSNANGSLITLDGADRVSIDGSFLGSGRYLRFLQRDATSSVIKLLNDAQNDTISNCVVEGLVTSTTSGLIVFGTADASGSGNDYGAVIGCLLRDTLGATALTTAYGNALISRGTAGRDNDSLTIDQNEFVNFNSSAIKADIGSGNTFMISNNKIYKTLNRNNANDVISINSGSGHSITGNSIGGAAPDRSGDAMTNTAVFNGILITNGVSGTYPTMIANNTLSNLASGTGTANFTPISVSGGQTTIQNNTIGGGAMPYDTIMAQGTSQGAITLTGGNRLLVLNNKISHLSNYKLGSVLLTGISMLALTTVPDSILVKGNMISNIKSAANGTGLISVYAPSGISVTGATIANINIIENSIRNIQNIATGTSVFSSRGIFINPGTASKVNIYRNRIKNIGASGSTGASVVSGIFIQNAAPSVVANNQISFGDSATGASVVYGLVDYGTIANHTYLNNSIHLYGTSSGTSNSAGYFRQATTTALPLLINNLIYNERTSTGTGRMLAFLNTSASGFTTQGWNNNLFVVADTAILYAAPTATMLSWTDLSNTYTTSANSNWAATLATVPSNQLFTDIANGDLSIIPTNDIAWFVNGKGLPIANESGDFNNASGVRSTSIASGAVDIGSVEFTASAAVPLAISKGVPAAGGTTSFYVASREIARIIWGTAGVLPTSVDLRYHTGENPANLIGGSSVMNAWWDIQPTGGSGYTYTLQLLTDSSVLGTVNNFTNLQMAYYENAGTLWSRDVNTVSNAAKGSIVSVIARNQMGIFTGTDLTNNPLPVHLMSFTASVQNNDVLLHWKTAAEIQNNGFTVERSLDGKQFKNIGFVKGNGTTQLVSTYQFNDEAVFSTFNGTVYYRLVQVDANNSTTTSPVVTVNKQRNKHIENIDVFPNPFVNEVQMNLNALSAGEAVITVTDITGKELFVKQSTIEIGFNNIIIEEAASLRSGVYIVNINIEGEKQVRKIIKQ